MCIPGGSVKSFSYGFPWYLLKLTWKTETSNVLAQAMYMNGNMRMRQMKNATTIITPFTLYRRVLFF